MDTLNIAGLVGFCLAGYSVVANDAIQTLGTFLSSNSKRPWWLLWIYSCSILTVVLLYGWLSHQGDVSYGRLAAIPTAGQVSWFHCLPPLVLLILTRFGFPVSTTFLILTFFAPSNLDGMLVKSVVGYVVAFVAAFLVYRYAALGLERRFLDTSKKPGRHWIAIQWLTTGFLWSQWLIQDLANIYVYLGHSVDFGLLALSLALLLGLHAYTFYVYGGSIQRIVTSKTNTTDIRAASLIDLLFGGVLLVFKEWSDMPMSTTWVFLGVLAGREIQLAMGLKRAMRPAGLSIGGDLAKAGAGLAVSVVLALGVPLLAQATGVSINPEPSNAGPRVEKPVARVP